MNIVSILILLSITVYTVGFGVTMWKDRQKVSALAVFFLTLALIILPFFSIFKQ